MIAKDTVELVSYPKRSLFDMVKRLSKVRGLSISKTIIQILEDYFKGLGK